jgi:hypothetical protein
LGKITADRQPKKYILTEMNVEKGSLSIRKIPPHKEKITFFKRPCDGLLLNLIILTLKNLCFSISL